MKNRAVTTELQHEDMKKELLKLGQEKSLRWKRWRCEDFHVVDLYIDLS